MLTGRKASEKKHMQYSKSCLMRPLKNNTKMVFNTDYRLMLVKSIAECSTCIKIPIDFKPFVLSIFEWPLKAVLL